MGSDGDRSDVSRARASASASTSSSRPGSPSSSPRSPPPPDDVFLEIGPGRGALTMPLAARVGRVVAVEIDRDLAAALQAKLPPTVSVVQADFLDVDFEELLQAETKPVRVVGNLPYNVSSPILFKLLHAADARPALF